MAKLTPYVSRVGDKVTTVSLNYGEITSVQGSALVIMRDDGSFYHASSKAVIRVELDGVAYAVSRRRNGGCYLLLMSTSWGEAEFSSYLVNKVRDYDTTEVRPSGRRNFPSNGRRTPRRVPINAVAN